MIKLKNINKSYHTKEGEVNAIKDISFEINEGEVISLIGPSGCGKSTILSLIASLDKEYTGNIFVDDNIKIGYMLQSDALLPYLTIYENAILGLKIQNKLFKNNLDYVDYLFKLYNLEEFKNKYPNSLSGGMKQRCALIRTLALSPNILLLDEPFSALDEQTRLLISNDIYKYCKHNNISILLVTHDINESIYLSDRIIILSKRPSTIKNIINIEIDESNIYKRKNHNKFNYYYDLIRKDLDKVE